jgi:uncharacterized surface protein with fasciclin (FAS1) repeats
VDHTKSILSHTQTSERYKALLAALQATDLDKVLGYDGQFTVFAPSNNAFENLSGITKERLMDPENKNILKAVMGYHIIAGKLSASKILRAMCSGEGSASFTTIQGEKITASMLGTDIVLTDKMGNSAKITTADVNQSNGVIHEVDTVFFPVRI